eukprot:TRINITY_DN42_c0_g1_i3.p1 TRINITY_DN42_c0_g1~~TRINITY_DN42_c0_g1_i3.p1  ORF type:complete len:280 (-),score=56.24 TRINITY_DN42_c0_g1_i3:255-1094(-)
MIRRPPRSTLSSSSAASDVYKRQVSTQSTGNPGSTMATQYASPAQRIRTSFPTHTADGGQTQIVAGPQASRYGHPHLDFKAAPSLFMDEDLSQEDFRLAHRLNVRNHLAAAEVYEAEAVNTRRNAEDSAASLAAAERSAARYAAETREIERGAVAQRAELEAKYQDAEVAAAAARNRADELRAMLASAAQEQARAQNEHHAARAAAENAATASRAGEYDAVNSRLANDNCYTERSALESQSHRGPLMSSLLGARGGYLQDSGAPGQVRSRCGIRTLGHP